MTIRLCAATLLDLFKYADQIGERIQPTSLTAIATCENYGYLPDPLVFVRWNGREIEALTLHTTTSFSYVVSKTIGPDIVLRECYEDFDDAVYNFNIQWEQFDNWDINRTNKIKKTPLDRAKFGYIQKNNEGKYEVIVSGKRLCFVPIQTVQQLFEFYA